MSKRSLERRREDIFFLLIITAILVVNFIRLADVGMIERGDGHGFALESLGEASAKPGLRGGRRSRRLLAYLARGFDVRAAGVSLGEGEMLCWMTISAMRHPR